MRIWTFLAFLFWAAGSAGAQDAPPEKLALTHVTVIDGTGAEPRPNMTVVLENGRISDLFESGQRPLPEGAEEIDLSGRHLIPGLVSAHVHFDQIGLGRDPERIRRELRRMLYGGVTTAWSAAGDARLISSLQRSIELGEVTGPDIYYTALMAGPDFMTNDPRIANGSAGIPRGQAAWLQTVTEATDPQLAVGRAFGTHATGVKIYIGVGADVIRAITEEAHRHGMKVWAHSTVFPDRPIDVVRAGVDVISHVCWIPWQDADLDPSRNVPYTHTPATNPRPTFDTALVETNSPEMRLLFREMARRGTMLDTTASALAASQSGSDSRGCTRDLAVGLLREAHEARVRFATGTDYFLPEQEPFPTVLREIDFLVNENVLTPLEAIKAATSNGAHAIGIERTHGTIAPGMAADLVVLREDPTGDIDALRTVEMVFKEGRRHMRADYDATLAGGESSQASAVERGVRQALSAEQGAFAAGDCDAVLEYYGDSEPLFITSGRVVPKRRNLMTSCAGIVARAPGPRQVLREEVVVLSPDTAYSVTSYAGSGSAPEAGAHSVGSVVTKLWVKQGDAWRIAHSHESTVPPR